MTVAEWIDFLQGLPPEWPVYVRDRDGDWVPSTVRNARVGHFTKQTGCVWALGEWFDVGVEDGPDNGVGIG